MESTVTMPLKDYERLRLKEVRCNKIFIEGFIASARNLIDCIEERNDLDFEKTVRILKSYTEAEYFEFLLIED